MTNAPRMEHAARTDVGQRREHNEDAILAAPPIFAVADGVGGAIAGERASALAIETLLAHAGEITSAAGTDAALQAMASAIEAVNGAIYTAQHHDPSLAGMATTMCAVVARGDGHELVLGHVGDSRTYRIGPAAGLIEQLTADHSVVAELVRSGQITPEEAESHPHRNAITRALGSEPHVAVDVAAVELPAGASVLLCSDGLTGHVADGEIAAIVQSHASAPARAVDELIALANERGGTDNISVVIIAAPIATTGPSPAEQSGQLAVMPIDKADTGSIPAITDDQVVATTPDEVAAEPLAPSAVAAADVAAEPVADDAGASGIMNPRRWLLAGGIVLVLVIAAVFTWSQSYYVTARDDGHLGINRGFPMLGLSGSYRTSAVLVADLSKNDRTKYLERHVLRSRADATRIYGQLEQNATDCPSKLDTTGVAGTDPTNVTLPGAGCAAGQASGG